jgi:hypothetical protein
VLARRHDGDGTQLHEPHIRIRTRQEKSKLKVIITHPKSSGWRRMAS